MNIPKVISSTLTAVALLFVGSFDPASASGFVTIGTGNTTGVYFASGKAICDFVNKGKKKHGLRCSAQTTGGSIDNIGKIRSGELDLGLAQSDWQHHAFLGTSKFQNVGEFKSLRSLFSLYAIPFTIVAREDAKIKNFDDLLSGLQVGKRIVVPRGSDKVCNPCDVGCADKDCKCSEDNCSSLTKGMKTGTFDMLGELATHPSSQIIGIANESKIRIIPLDTQAANKIASSKPFFRRTLIPGNMYRNNPNDVRTFGIGATVVGSAESSEQMVYEVVKSVFENFAAFKKRHPALGSVEIQDSQTG